MKGKGIIILGSGKEVEFLLKNIEFKDIKVLAYGNGSLHNFDNKTLNFCLENKIQIIENHKEVVKFRPKFILMMSYAPLIEEKYLANFNFINIHGALLPKYRGMHGGTWAVVNGEKNHGYTIHKVDEGIDSGPIFFQESIESKFEDNINVIRDKIYSAFKEKIIKVIQNIYHEKIEAVAQNEEDAIYVSKRHPEDGLIDWSNSSEEIFNLIKALAHPYTAGAYTYYKNEKLFIRKALFVKRDRYIGINGQVLSKLQDGGCFVKTGDSMIIIKEVFFRDKLYRLDEIIKMVGVRLG